MLILRINWVYIMKIVISFNSLFLLRKLDTTHHYSFLIKEINTEINKQNTFLQEGLIKQTEELIYVCT